MSIIVILNNIIIFLFLCSWCMYVPTIVLLYVCATGCGWHRNTGRQSGNVSALTFMPNFYETYIIGSNFKDTYCPWTEKYVQRGGHWNSVFLLICMQVSPSSWQIQDYRLSQFEKKKIQALNSSTMTKIVWKNMQTLGKFHTQMVRSIFRIRSVYVWHKTWLWLNAPVVRFGFWSISVSQL